MRLVDHALAGLPAHVLDRSVRRHCVIDNFRLSDFNVCFQWQRWLQAVNIFMYLFSNTSRFEVVRDQLMLFDVAPVVADQLGI